MQGFLHLLAEIARQIEVVSLREGHDDEAQNHDQARTLLVRHRDLAGIYNIGGGAAGIARALRETRRHQVVAFIGHGLTPDTRALLTDRTMAAVITRNATLAMHDCLAIVRNLHAGRPPLDGVRPTRSEILFREILPV